MAIDQDDQAQRLARALLKDVVLYSGAKLAPGQEPRGALAAELTEARGLFHQRVAPALHAVFERELAAFDFSGAAARSRGPAPKKVLLVCAVAIAVAALLAVYLLLPR